MFVFDLQEARLSLIATDRNYRQNFTAADDLRTSKMATIETIINMIVRLFSSLLFSLSSLNIETFGFQTNSWFISSFQTNETKDVVCPIIYLFIFI